MPTLPFIAPKRSPNFICLYVVRAIERLYNGIDKTAHFVLKIGLRLIGKGDMEFEIINDRAVDNADYLLISRVKHLNYTAEITKDYEGDELYLVDIFDDNGLPIEESEVAGISIEDGTVAGIEGYGRAARIAAEILESIAI